MLPLFGKNGAQILALAAFSIILLKKWNLFKKENLFITSYPRKYFFLQRLFRCNYFLMTNMFFGKICMDTFFLHAIFFDKIFFLAKFYLVTKFRLAWAWQAQSQIVSSIIFFRLFPVFFLCCLFFSYQKNYFTKVDHFWANLDVWGSHRRNELIKKISSEI